MSLTESRHVAACGAPGSCRAALFLLLHSSISGRTLQFRSGVYLDKGDRIMRYHVHPYSGAVIEGRRLELGELLEKGDKYATYEGTWRRCPKDTIGVKMLSTKTVWVRPHRTRIAEVAAEPQLLLTTSVGF
jgi:hypothetical protein